MDHAFFFSFSLYFQVLTMVHHGIPLGRMRLSYPQVAIIAKKKKKGNRQKTWAGVNSRKWCDGNLKTGQ